METNEIPQWLTSDEGFQSTLAKIPRCWLVTGVAGFIGSNILETLLLSGQVVRGMDNFSTGYQRNLDEVEESVGPENWKRFTFIQGDIREIVDCERALSGVEHVLHQAALGSVPRSISDPLTTNSVNIGGFLNMLDCARRSGVESFVYAASSSTYGDEPNLPKIESRIGNPLSPYAVTKLVNEQYAAVYSKSYGFKATGLRYFNVFGPRQDPSGAYAAVIPIWTASMIRNEAIQINGDGETSRDFCYVDNVVQANLKASLHGDQAQGEVYNVAVGGRTSLNVLFGLLRDSLASHGKIYDQLPIYGDFRVGDVLHSQADISKAKEMLAYNPSHDISSGVRAAMPWYLQHLE